MGSIEEIAGVVFPPGNVVVAGNIFGYSRERVRRVSAADCHGDLPAAMSAGYSCLFSSSCRR
jgi:hypothetical protein